MGDRFEGLILQHLVYFLGSLAVGDPSLHEESTRIVNLRRVLLASEDHEVALAAYVEIQLVPLAYAVFLGLRHGWVYILRFRCF